MLVFQLCTCLRYVQSEVGDFGRRHDSDDFCAAEFKTPYSKNAKCGMKQQIELVWKTWSCLFKGIQVWYWGALYVLRFFSSLPLCPVVLWNVRNGNPVASEVV